MSHSSHTHLLLNALACERPIRRKRAQRKGNEGKTSLLWKISCVMLEDLCLMISSYVLGQACCPSQNQVMAINWLSLIKPYVCSSGYIWMILHYFIDLHFTKLHMNSAFTPALLLFFSESKSSFDTSAPHHSYSSAFIASCYFDACHQKTMNRDSYSQI